MSATVPVLDPGQEGGAVDAGPFPGRPASAPACRFGLSRCQRQARRSGYRPRGRSSDGTSGGNAIQDQNVNLHHEWDDIPTDIGEAATRELLSDAREVSASQGRIEDW